MIFGRKVLALIPARGGSKGIPRKNLCELDGRSLLSIAIQQAAASKYVDRIVVSSENDEILAEARRCNADVPFVRPAHLATDEATSRAVALHALDALSEAYDYLVLLQPTSPLRIAADIDGCLELCYRGSAHSAATVSEVDKPPQWMYLLEAGSARLRPLIGMPNRPTRRQDIPPCYALNGAVFVVAPQQLADGKDFISEDTLGYVIPAERSIDIDRPIDLLMAQTVLKAMKDGTL